MRLCFGGIELQQESVSLLCARTGQSVKLGAKEYQLLELFLRNPRQVLPRETIVERVWGFDNEAEYNTGGLPVLCAPQAAIRRLDRGNSRHARRGLRIGGGRMLETLRRRLTWLVIGILVLISAGLIASTGADKNALLVTGGNVTVTDSKLVRESADSTGGDSASFYGVGAAALVTGGTLTIENTEISTDAEGGAGVFACGSGVATAKNTVISTKKGTSGGIHVAGGGTLYAENLTVTTEGASSAAIRSDRGGGTMVVNGGSYTASGFGSPAVYVTADISISDATLTATGSEALCLEGKNSVTLTNCTLSGGLPDLEQNDNTWTVILYQSMSGDSEVGKGTFTMTGGTLISNNGGLFYTTNTDSEFTLRNVTLQASADRTASTCCAAPATPTAAAGDAPAATARTASSPPPNSR